MGDLLTGIRHDAQRCRSYLDDITGGAKGGYTEGFALFEDIMQRTAAELFFLLGARQRAADLVQPFAHPGRVVAPFESAWVSGLTYGYDMCWMTRGTQ